VSTDGRPRFLSDISASARIHWKRRIKERFQYNRQQQRKKSSHTTFTDKGVVILNLGDALVTTKGKVLNTQGYLIR
jgi:hypothetical protein